MKSPARSLGVLFGIGIALGASTGCKKILEAEYCYGDDPAEHAFKLSGKDVCFEANDPRTEELKVLAKKHRTFILKDGKAFEKKQNLRDLIAYLDALRTDKKKPAVDPLFSDRYLIATDETGPAKVKAGGSHPLIEADRSQYILQFSADAFDATRETNARALNLAYTQGKIPAGTHGVIHYDLTLLSQLLPFYADEYTGLQTFIANSFGIEVGESARVDTHDFSNASAGFLLRMLFELPERFLTEKGAIAGISRSLLGEPGAIYYPEDRWILTNLGLKEWSQGVLDKDTDETSSTESAVEKAFLMSVATGVFTEWMKSRNPMLVDYLEMSWRPTNDGKKYEWVAGSETIHPAATRKPIADFIYHVAAYVHAPERLKTRAPHKYDWIHGNLFPSREYKTDGKKIYVESESEDIEAPDWVLDEGKSPASAVNLGITKEGFSDTPRVVALLHGLIEPGNSGINEVTVFLQNEEYPKSTIYLGLDYKTKKKSKTSEERFTVSVTGYLNSNTMPGTYRFASVELEDRVQNERKISEEFLSKLPKLKIPASVIPRRETEKVAFDYSQVTATGVSSSSKKFALYDVRFPVPAGWGSEVGSVDLSWFGPNGRMVTHRFSKGSWDTEGAISIRGKTATMRVAFPAELGTARLALYSITLSQNYETITAKIPETHQISVELSFPDQPAPSVESNLLELSVLKGKNSKFGDRSIEVLVPVQGPNQNLGGEVSIRDPHGEEVSGQLIPRSKTVKDGVTYFKAKVELPPHHLEGYYVLNETSLEVPLSQLTGLPEGVNAPSTKSYDSKVMTVRQKHSFRVVIDSGEIGTPKTTK